MGRHNPTTARRSAGPAGVRVRALLSLGMVVGLGAVGTLAAWSDEATATATFSAGKLDLQLAGDADDEVALTSVSVSNMYPGSSWAGMINVANKGTLPFEYSLASSFADIDGGVLGAGVPATAGQPAYPGLQVQVYSGGVVTNTATQGTCSGDLVGGGPLGGVLFSERGPLNRDAFEDLCIRLSLPLEASNEMQGDSTKVTFTFNAGQVS